VHYGEGREKMRDRREKMRDRREGRREEGKEGGKIWK
jgi:hypothetical protein